MTFNGVLFKTINYIKIFIKHMLFSYVFWTIFGLTKLLDFIYIYIYIYIHILLKYFILLDKTKQL